MFSFPQLSPSNSVCTSPLPHTFHRPHSSRSSLSDHPHNFFCWGVHAIRLLITQPSPIRCYQIPLRLQYPSQRLLLEHFEPIYHCIYNTESHTVFNYTCCTLCNVGVVYPSSSEESWLTIKAAGSVRRVNTCLLKCLLADNWRIKTN